MADLSLLYNSYSVDETIETVFIDIGSYDFKIGVGREVNMENSASRDGVRRGFSPSFPCVVGRTCLYPEYDRTNQNFFGEDCFSRLRSVGRIERPIRGMTVDMDVVEGILFYSIYRHAGLTPEDSSLILSDIPLRDKFTNNSRRRNDLYCQKLLQIAFENYAFQGVSLVDTGVVSIYLSGKSTGVVVDIGHELARVIPIYEGFPIQHAQITLQNPTITGERNKNISGDRISEFLLDLLEKGGKYQLSGYEKYETEKIRYFSRDSIHKMKERMCYVTTDRNEINFFKKKESRELQDEMYQNLHYDGGKQGKKSSSSSSSSSLQKEEETITFSHTDLLGNEIKISNVGKELYLAPEILFHPKLIGYDIPGIHHILKLAIEKCPLELQDEMYQNIVLVGGTTLLKNFKKRFEMELHALLPKNQKINILSFPEFGVTSGIEGMKLLEKDPQHRFVSLECYDDYGESILFRRCPHLLMIQNNFDHELSNYKFRDVYLFHEEDDDEKERLMFVFKSILEGGDFKIVCGNTLIAVGFKFLL